MNTTMKRELLTVALVVIATMGVARAAGTNSPTASSQPPVPATNNTAKPTASPPKIQFDKTVYDFGTTSLVDSLTGTFTFHNAGRGTLRVGKMGQISVIPDVLKPGEAGELVFKLAIQDAEGTIEQFISVPSNDPQTPNVSLSIKVKLEPILKISPRYIQLGNIRQGTITNVAVLVHRTDGKKLVITKAEPSNKLLRVRLVPVTGTDKQSAIVIVDIDGVGAPRQFSEYVKLSLEGITQPLPMIMVNGRLLGDVTLEPASLYWPIADSSSTNSEMPSAREIKVSAVASNQTLEVKNLTTNVKDLKLELITKTAGKTYVVLARFTNMPKQSARGTITFETNTASQPKVAIPVTISILKQPR
jgi:hypothetical protein